MLTELFRADVKMYRNPMQEVSPCEKNPPSSVLKVNSQHPKLVDSKILKEEGSFWPHFTTSLIVMVG